VLPIAFGQGLFLVCSIRSSTRFCAWPCPDTRHPAAGQRQSAIAGDRQGVAALRALRHDNFSEVRSRSISRALARPPRNEPTFGQLGPLLPRVYGRNRSLPSSTRFWDWHPRDSPYRFQEHGRRDWLVQNVVGPEVKSRLQHVRLALITGSVHCDDLDGRSAGAQLADHMQSVAARREHVAQNQVGLHGTGCPDDLVAVISLSNRESSALKHAPHRQPCHGRIVDHQDTYGSRLPGGCRGSAQWCRDAT
jgi:hypothetical protein